MQNELNEIYFFLDFEKPFDSVEYNVMFKTLESFNFGDKFIDIIKPLHNDHVFKIKKKMVGYRNHGLCIEEFDRNVLYPLFC